MIVVPPRAKACRRRGACLKFPVIPVVGKKKRLIRGFQCWKVIFGHLLVPAERRPWADTGQEHQGGGHKGSDRSSLVCIVACLHGAAPRVAPCPGPLLPSPTQTSLRPPSSLFPSLLLPLWPGSRRSPVDARCAQRCQRQRSRPEGLPAGDSPLRRPRSKD